MHPPRIVTRNGASTEFLVEMSRDVTWIEHVLAYCRIGKKYMLNFIGCNDLLFCLCDLAIWH